MARNHQEDAVDLLEEVSVATGMLGGHRLLLRLSLNSQLDAEARSACFDICSAEDLYYRPRGRHTWTAVSNGRSTVRPARSEDMHDMFRVHVRSTPGPIRQAGGLTFTQWSDARDRGASPPSRRMLAYESEGDLIGYASLAPAAGRTLIEIVTAPGDSNGFCQIADTIVESVGQETDLLFLAPSQRPDIGRLVEQRGFHQIDELRLYAKHIAAPASHRELIAVGA